ncbi:MAG: hypothetical protein SFH39_12145 [Candidatus Magnetobacterium sp. LHC-1]|nr:hypothetical protein [Nitrospirota bacterium]
MGSKISGESSDTLMSLGDKGQKGRMFLVTVHPGATNQKEDSMAVSVNGQVLQIKYGHPVTLPERFVECLRNSTVDICKDEAPRSLYPFTAVPVDV